jgi:hypothetical protein
MKKLVSAMAIVLFCVATACGGSGSFDPSNVLLGKWKLVPDAVHIPSCLATMEFTAKTYTGTETNGKTISMPVTYVTGGSKTPTFPTTVYVLTDAGINAHTTYNFASRDKMILNTAAMCSYSRM